MHFLLALLLAATGLPAGTIQVHGADLAWKSSPALPPGAQLAVLEGDPTKSGLFTIRVQFAAGTVVPPHYHPRQERVTVLSGTMKIGFGDAIDRANVTAFAPGDFYVNPPNAHHFVLIDEKTTVQITGEGPWEVRKLE